MSVNVTFNGQVYTIPQPHDTNWGANLTSFFLAIPAGALQKTGGNFDLSADVNFGASFGLITKYLKSRSANIATTGFERLANSDTINFRNFGNTADLPLGVNASNQLTFNGTPLAGGGGVATIQSDSNPLLSGAVQFVSGTNISLSQVGQAITINGSASGANTALSNLISTSINQSLVPSADASFQLGTSSNRWFNNFFERTDITEFLNLHTDTQLRFNNNTAIGVTYASGDQNLYVENNTSGRGLYLKSGVALGAGGFVQLAVQPSGGGPHAALTVIDTDGSTPSLSFGINGIGFGTIFKLDNNSTSGETPMLLYDIATNTLSRVSVGAADSGGVGFKVLRIPN